MKISRKQLYEILNNLKPSPFKHPDINIVSSTVSKFMNVPETDSLKTELKKQLLLFKRFCKNREKSFSDRLDDIHLEYVIDSEDFDVDDKPDKDKDEINPKKKRKAFRDLTTRMQRERTQKLVDLINQFVEEEEDETLTPNDVLGYLLYRFNHLHDKHLSNLGSDIFNRTFDNANAFTLDEAITLMHTLVLSKEQMRKMKCLLESHGVYFPNTTDINEARKKLRPPVFPVLNCKGVGVNYKSVVAETGTAIFDNLLKDGVTISDEMRYKLKMKDGCDGAGQQAIWHSKSMVNAKGNMFQYGIIPLSVTSNGNEIWRNKTPNSSECLRPIFMIRESESDKEMMEFVIKGTDEDRCQLNTHGIGIKCGELNLRLDLEILDTMKDMKLKRSISGLGGAPCILCTTQVNDWSDLGKIKDGFPIDRNAGDTLELFQRLVDENGDIAARPKDFAERKGLTKKPITNSSQHSIAITHSYINVTSWMLKLIYRLEAEYFKWTEKKTIIGEPIRRAKDRVFEKIVEDSGLVLDVVCDAGDKGGTSTDGNQGRAFFLKNLSKH